MTKICVMVRMQLSIEMESSNSLTLAVVYIIWSAILGWRPARVLPSGWPQRLAKGGATCFSIERYEWQITSSYNKDPFNHPEISFQTFPDSWRSAAC